MKFKKKIIKKRIKDKTNSNQKNENQIWHKNKMKPNVWEMKLKKKSIKKG
jgi:hypothetical protein